MLTEYPRLRKALYTIYSVLGLALGATQVGYATADAGTPVWLKVTIAVFAFLGAGLGFTAATNTTARLQPGQVRIGKSGLVASGGTFGTTPGINLYVDGSNAIEQGRRIQAALDAYCAASGGRRASD